MRVELSKNGNSTAFRLPKSAISGTGASVGDAYELIVQADGSYLFKPYKSARSDWFKDINTDDVKSEAAVMEQDFSTMPFSDDDGWEHGEEW